MNTVQVQRLRKKENINTKLDRIADLLEILVKMQEDESYPPESKMNKSFIKECQKILKEIRSVKPRVHTRTYKSMAEFTKTLG